MRSSKGSHKIVVNGIEFRWRATGDDGYINVGIWPSNNIGPYIYGNLRYHESWIPRGDGSHTSTMDQIIVTNRIVRRIIEHAVAEHGYAPNVKGPELRLLNLEPLIEWEDAVRASRRSSQRK